MTAVARILVVAIMVGCAGGESLPSWRLEVEGRAETAVTLPASLLLDVPFAARSYRLVADAPIPPGTGEPITLVFDCFHGPLALRVDGVEIPDLGDVAVGEHRFVIAAPRGTLHLELRVAHDVLSMPGFGVAPRLVRGALTSPGVAATFNRDTAIAELGLIVVFALMFGVAFVLDRKRTQDAAFAAGVLAAAVAPLWQLGILRELFGDWGSVALGIGISGTQLAVLYFVHLAFELGPPPKWMVRLYAALAAANVLDVWSYPAALAIHVGYSAAGVLFAVHVVPRLVQAARAGRDRHDARLLLVTMVITAVAIAPDLLGMLTGRSPLGGVHLVSLAVITFSIAQSLALARQQATRQRALEQTAAELRRQVSERSRELADALAKLSQPPRPLESDRLIDGRYRVVRRLGSGGMGTVYEVERTRDGEHLALKTLRGRSEPDVMARFAREAQIAAELSHPNLVPVLDVGIADDGLFLVMPLVTGGSLEQQRAKFGDAAWARPILRSIAAGLGALHDRGIVHRDLKPANVLLDGGVARIADFGLATLRANGSADTVAGDSIDGALAVTAAPLTRAGDVFGTPAYMAPELAAGVHDIKSASDVFAFGLIAHELVTGRAAFAEPPLVARLHGRPIELAPGTDAMIARCLDLDPQKRPSADELARW
jgi:hypothetical protein